jgi:hypothetical protein
MNYKFTELRVHNLVPEGAEDERYIVIPSGFDDEVLVVAEDAYGAYSIERISVKKCEKRFGIKLTIEELTIKPVGEADQKCAVCGVRRAEHYSESAVLFSPRKH